ncbi:MAG: TonB-dependent receptor [Candidatus Edwardsbacteria bacterium]|nr:TonB-dependent receptor [Candidatus Edwardsbacteria bacterium]
MFVLTLLATVLITLPADSMPVKNDVILLKSPPERVDTAASARKMYYLKEVVITATRTPISLPTAPASVSVIVPDALTPSQSVQSSLAQIAGASFGAQGGQGSISSLFLRGAKSENVLVLLDGVPLNSPLLGSYDLNKISGNADRVEVVRGPVSSLYGANAVGGVVNIVTSRPRGGKPYSRITYEKGNYGSQLLKAKFSRDLSQRLAMWLGADWNSTGGQRPNSAYDATNYMLGAEVGPVAGLTARAQFQDYKSEAGEPGTISDTTLNNKQSDKQQDVTLRLSRGADSGTVFRGGALCLARSTVFNGRLYKDYFQNDAKNYNDSRQSTVDGQYSFSSLPALTLTAGGSYLKSECHSDKSGEHIMRQRSVFATAQYSGVNNLLLAPSVRHDKNYFFNAQVSPSFSASYMIDGPCLVAYASYDQAFRAPTVNDLFYKDDIWMYYGNQNLMPERSWQGEAGAKIEQGRFAFTGSVFFGKTRDMIDWAPLPDGSWRVTNLFRTKAIGVEAALSANVLSWLKADVNYTYCKATMDDSINAVLPYRPLNLANGSLTVNDFKLTGNLWLGWKFTAKYTDCQNAGPWVSTTVPRFIICDQTVSLKIRDARVFYRVDNLFNANYQTRYGYPMPRRSYAFGISMELWD